MAPDAPPRASARTIVAVALIGLSGAWNAGNVGPVASEIGAEFDVSLATVGLLSGTLFFGSTVLGLVFAAQVGNRTGLLPGLRLACLLLIAGNVIFAVSPVFAGLAFARILPGLGFALVNALGAVYAREAGGVRLIGVYGASIQLGVAGALAVGSGLADLGLDWRVGFAISAALGAAALLALPTDGAEPALPPTRPNFLRAALRHARVYRLALLFIALYGVPMTLGAWLIEYLHRDGDVATALAGGLSFLLFGLSAATRILGAQLLQRGAPHRALVAALALAAAGLTALAIDPVEPVALVAVVALGFGFAIPYATMLLSAQQLFPEAPSEPVALMTLAGLAMPIPVIPLVGHALSNGHGELAMLALAAYLVLAVAANLRRSGIPLSGPAGTG